jgi:hypothetical protein
MLIDMVGNNLGGQQASGGGPPRPPPGPGNGSGGGGGAVAMPPVSPPGFIGKLLKLFLVYLFLLICIILVNRVSIHGWSGSATPNEPSGLSTISIS